MQGTDAPPAAAAAPFSSTSASLLHFSMQWHLAKNEQNELRRRQWLAALYLLRDPFYASALSCAPFFCQCGHRCVMYLAPDTFSLLTP